jgi:uncharacterized membrane-anchored protein YhcB (DUF1043 family)
MVVEIIAGIVIGIIVGIVLVYAIMQSRLNNKVRIEASRMFEQQKDQLWSSLQSETRADLDKWKAEYEQEVRLRIEDAEQ